MHGHASRKAPRSITHGHVVGCAFIHSYASGFPTRSLSFFLAAWLNDVHTLLTSSPGSGPYCWVGSKPTPSWSTWPELTLSGWPGSVLTEPIRSIYRHVQADLFSPIHQNVLFGLQVGFNLVWFWIRTSKLAMSTGIQSKKPANELTQWKIREETTQFVNPTLDRENLRRPIWIG